MKSMPNDSVETPDSQLPAIILRQALESLRAHPPRRPESTYRLQFTSKFTFPAARDLVPYLHDLGISDCYASPYLKARPGSLHGYDVVDHSKLNPEVGTEEEYTAWVEQLQRHSMSHILDFVPNHMGIIGNENAWWNDVLENGPCSHYAGFFDIDWHPPKAELNERVLLAVLGDPYGKALEAGQIRLSYDNGSYFVHYFENRFPVAVETTQPLLRHRLETVEESLGKNAAEVMEYQSILTAIAHLPPRNTCEPGKIEERYREKEVIKRRLATLTESSAPVREFVEENVEIFNGTTSDPRSFDLLDNLLNDQSYRLAFWRVATDEINYRRFFDVNDLAAICVEKVPVFEASHAFVLSLVGRRKVGGLRIDHLDGLYDPRHYLERLQRYFVLEECHRVASSRPDFREDGWPQLRQQLTEQLTPSFTSNGSAKDRPTVALGSSKHQIQPLYVVVEKILIPKEPIPDSWITHGTTGYEFLNMVNGLFVESAHEVAMSRLYQRWTGMDPSYREYVYQKKFLILQVSLSSELYLLSQQLDRLSEKNRWSRDFTRTSLRHALRAIIACFPVYRSYISVDDDPVIVLPRDRHYIEQAVGQAKRRNPALSSSIFDFIRDILLLRYPTGESEADRGEQRLFVGKFQEVTGAMMAKGVEDTAFYVYNRLVSLNEVGGDPGRFGVQPPVLHHFFEERRRHWPRALSATATHDTKRGEDVRARINILSEIPRQWRKALFTWARSNNRHKTEFEGTEAPDRNDEYLLYQTLVGAWPTEAMDAQAREVFVERIRQYMAKAVREAKVHSSWINPNQEYDEAVSRFITRILDVKQGARFLNSFVPIQAEISRLGFYNSLAQTLLKIAAPGVPDTYQGTELWDFSLVDPDNRRPVDYELRRRQLTKLKSASANTGELISRLLDNMNDGRIKLYIIERALHCRMESPALFTEGEYLAAAAHGPRADNVFAFVRRHGRSWAVAAVPRLITRLAPKPGDRPLDNAVWHDTFISLPGIEPGQSCRNIFTGEVLTTQQRDDQAVLPAAEVFATFPVALLISNTEASGAR
jgi:(1->4)-alpha-D-glucan 1-alpha-D-glucosylmutase